MSQPEKKIREGERTVEVLQKIAPTLGEGSVCDKANHDDRAIAQLGKQDKKWALLLASGSQLLTEKAQRHLKAILKEDDAANAPVSIVASDSEGHSKTSFEKNCFSAWASTLNMGLINKVDMVCLSPVGYGV